MSPDASSPPGVRQLWRSQGIARKLGLVFFAFLCLAIFSVLMALGALQMVRSAESEILLGMDIRQKTYEMDGDLEKARRLYWDFLLNYREVGFQEAQDRFGKPAIESLARAATVNGELARLLRSPGTSKALRESDNDIALYLSLTQRFSESLLYHLELLIAMAEPDSGLEARLDRTASILAQALASSPGLLSLALEARNDQIRYKTSRQRPIMQSALNSLERLRLETTATRALPPEAARQILALTDQWRVLAGQILATDVALRDVRTAFSLQAQTLAPISERLKSLTISETARLRGRIDSLVGAATAAVVLTTLLCIVGGVVLSRVVRLTVTDKLAALTNCAEKLRAGDLEASVSVDSTDELGVLADTFNAMTHRIKDLVENLEDKVRLRTQELFLKNRELDEKNKVLEVLSLTDRLTGLCNRRKIDEALRVELRRIRRYGGGFALIMADLDHFKRVNDTFGHARGDSVLIRLADILTGLARETDIVGRWGGEEFLIVCPQTDREAAQHLAERLRHEIEATDFDGVRALTASFGLTTSRSDDDPQTILHRADLALYQAKSLGRNTVVIGG